MYLRSKSHLTAHGTRGKNAWFVAVAMLLLFASSKLREVSGAEQAVGIGVDADTMIAFDSNSIAPGEFGNGLEQSTPHGNLEFMTIRGGTPFLSSSLTAKPLIRFDLGGSPMLDPDLPYFLEVTTDTNGNSNDTFRVYSISDSATQSFDEATFTWDFADANAPNASANLNNYTAAGPEVGVFFAPSPGAAGVKLQTPMLGSQINTFMDGTTFATFGFTSTETNRMELRSKEQNGGVDQARLFTYSQETSNGGGALNAAGTWNGGIPIADTLYRVVSGDAVSVDGVGVFAGRGVVVDNGTLEFTASEVDIQTVVLNAGGNLGHSVGGSLAIGSPTSDRNGAGLILNRNLTYTAGAGEDLTINLPLRSQIGRTFTFEGGIGSDLALRYPQGHRGHLLFNGSGDELILGEDEGIGGTWEMNSDGANRLVFGANAKDTEQEFGVGTVVFNQPGSIDHRSTSDRLQGLSFLEVNAPLTVDLTLPPVGSSELLLRITRDITGEANITVNGRTTAPGASGETRNQFEISTTDGNTTNIRSVDYAGTITTMDYVTVEAHADLPEAKVVVNQNGVLTTGYRLGSVETFQIGEIEVLGGGELNVGYLAPTELAIMEQHQVQELRLTTFGGRSGDLTLAAGSTTRMQINSDPNTNAFDTVIVEGTASLGGTLEILLNHDIPNVDGAPPDAQYFPVSVGDKWNIITAAASAADFDGSGLVDDTDLTKWEADYGLNEGSDADGDGDSDGADFLIWQRSLGQTSGNLSGAFDNVIINDFFGDLAAAGLAMQINYVGSSVVQVEVVSASPIAAVPEPTAVTLLFLCSILSSRILARENLPDSKDSQLTPRFR